MDRISKELTKIVRKIQSGQMTSDQIAQWAYVFQMDNPIYRIQPKLYDVLCELGGMDADEDSFRIPLDEIVKMLEPFIFKEPIYYLYYPSWPNKDSNEITFDVIFPSLSEDDSATLAAFLFTEVDGMIYEVKSCLENVLSGKSPNESYSGNIFYLQMNPETTTIFNMFSDEADDSGDDNEEDSDDVREIQPEMTIETYLLLHIMKDYRQKKNDFPVDWCPDFIINTNPEDITTEMVLALAGNA